MGVVHHQKRQPDSRLTLRRSGGSRSRHTWGLTFSSPVANAFAAPVTRRPPAGSSHPRAGSPDQGRGAWARPRRGILGASCGAWPQPGLAGAGSVAPGLLGPRTPLRSPHRVPPALAPRALAPDIPAAGRGKRDTRTGSPGLAAHPPAGTVNGAG